MKKLFLIDASGYLYRSYFAIRNMTNSQGKSTNALFGFIRSILKLIKDFKPDHLASVFDGPRNAQKRVQIYKDYKAHRAITPPDLVYQIKWAHEFCEAAGIPQLNIAESEADDIMASVAKWAENTGSTVYLCTSDKDMCQMVNDKILLLNTFKENLIINAEEVEKIHGVPPQQIIDLLAMVGDSSDNIPGLAGFGPKTAAELLKSLGSLDYILQHPEEVPGKKKQDTLIQGKEIALMCRQLVTLDCHVAIPQEEQYYLLKPADHPKLKEFYASMNFNSLIKEMGMEPTNTVEGTTVEEEYSLIDDEEAFTHLLKTLSNQNEIGFKIETTDTNPHLAELVGFAFSCEAKKAWYVPTNGKLGLNRVLEGLKPLFENPKIRFYGHNVKHDLHVLNYYTIKVKNVAFDTLLASYILNAHSRQHSIEALTLEYFGKVKSSLALLLGKGKNQITVNEVPLKDICKYSCEEIDYVCRIKNTLQTQLKERKLEKLLLTLELPLMLVLAQMERRGIYLDVGHLKEFAAEIVQEIEKLQEELYSLAGTQFNLNSPSQLQKVLFEDLKIPYPKKRSESLSTGEEILELLKPEYPIAGKILEYRKLEKLRSTYVDSLPEQVNPKDQRIHCTFNQSVAATGRLSCQDPNLQNIPVRTEMGRKIREAFTPQKKGWSYVSADYSQIELRILAHLSEDPFLIDAFQQKIDIHTLTAASIYDIPVEKVTKGQRHNAKAVNFGILYGQQAFGLSQELNISTKEAQAFIDTYFKQFTKVREFLESSKEKARKTGKTVTYTGRERLIPEINSSNGMLRSQAERLAVNTPIQGTAADLIKMAMLRVDQLLQKHHKIGYMILQIHDELIFEVPDFELIDFQPLVREAMENVFKLKVPLIVDISIGKNWKEC